jgi:DNA-binding MarR family transcriptional regulator
MPKRENPTDIERTLGALLRRPYEDLAGRLYAELARRGYADVRVAHSPVLRHIAPDGSRITELAELAGITKQSMGYLVESLGVAGYTEMVEDPQDGRAKLVRLTRRGRELHRSAMQISRQFEEEYARRIGAENMRKLRELLETLYDTMDAPR